MKKLNKIKLAKQAHEISQELTVHFLNRVEGIKFNQDFLLAVYTSFIVSTISNILTSMVENHKPEDTFDHHFFKATCLNMAEVLISDQLQEGVKTSYMNTKQ